MTLDRQKGDLIFQCDGCYETLETNTSDFDSARNIQKRAGWKVRPQGGEWLHFCPKCRS